MKKFLVAVLICFLLGWNIGIMISNNMLKIENKNLREEIKLYKDKNGVKIFGNVKNVNQKNIWSLKCKSKKIFGVWNVVGKTNVRIWKTFFLKLYPRTLVRSIWQKNLRTLVRWKNGGKHLFWCYSWSIVDITSLYL